LYFAPFLQLIFQFVPKEKEKDISSQSKVKFIVVYVEVGDFDFFFLSMYVSQLIGNPMSAKDQLIWVKAGNDI
jgi:hypothetical protein